MRFTVILGALVLSCGAPAKPAPVSPPSDDAPPPSAADAKPADPKPDEKSAPPPAPEPVSHTLPMSCASSGDLCVPDPAFVKRFCNGNYPDVALVLMSKDAPFTRMYMRADVDGWNADGGASARAHLSFDEEMLVLRRRNPPANGIVVGAGAGYLVMRWDGNCYTLEESELSAKKPPSPKHPSLPWRHYAEKTKNALLERPKIQAAFQKRGKECKGAVSGEVSRACEQADTALSTTIVSEIRSGATIPTPERLP